MTRPDVTEFKGLGDLHEAATGFVADQMTRAVKKHGITTLFLSGGSTPGPVYQRLSSCALDWSQINIAQVDDRWVGLADPGSNAALLKKTILKNKAAKAPFIRMKSRHKTAERGQSTVEAVYRKLPMSGSVAVLGMGADGHICSWFPNASGLQQALNPANDNYVQAIFARRSKITGPYLERMTLTLSALNKCESSLLLISGSEKRKVIEKALTTGNTELPVSHFIKSAGNRLRIMWAD